MKSWLVSQEPALAEKIFLPIDTADGIQLGERWKEALQQGLARSDVVVCLLSREWADSRECLSEYRAAETLGKRIVPGRLENSSGREITEWVNVSLFSDGGATTDIDLGDAAPLVRFSSEGLARLLAAVLRRDTFVSAPERARAGAAAPMAHESSDSVGEMVAGEWAIGADLPGIYLSHSNPDSREAIALKSWLVSQEPALADKIFLDVDPAGGFELGARWKDSLRQGLRRSEVVICLLSPGWAGSRECLSELRAAEMLGKRIIPARLEYSDLDVVSEWQIVDLFGDGAMTVIELAGCTPSVSFSSKGLVRLRDALFGRRATVGVWPPRGEPDRPPYRGWAPFEEIDTAVFFGRDGIIARAMDTLRINCVARSTTLAAVVGPSGSGKSSFLRAGLMPRLRADDHFVLLDLVRPEPAVLTGDSGLAQAIWRKLAALGAPGPALGEIKQACLAADAERVHALLLETSRLAALMQFGDAEDAELPKVVVPLDQAEELFNADAGPQADVFLQLLADLAERNGAGPPLIVVATIRTDRYEVMQLCPDLAGVQTEVLLELEAMPATHFKDIITAPAARSTSVGCPLRLDYELVDLLLADAAAGANSLPLLELTLQRVYDAHRGVERLTLNHYFAMGGIGGVAREDVNEVLSVDPTQRAHQLAVLRTAFIPWLVGITADDEPIRRVARYTDLPEDSRPLIDSLVNKRLLVRDQREGQTVIEVAWDGLWRLWDDLAGWLREERDELLISDDIVRNATESRIHDRDPNWLLTGSRCSDAETAVATTTFGNWLTGAREYLAPCRAAENERLAVEE